jgi:hypothetical protein
MIISCPNGIFKKSYYLMKLPIFGAIIYLSFMNITVSYSYTVSLVSWSMYVLL